MTVATRRLAAIVAGCAVALFAASAAQAFTLQNQGATDSNGDSAAAMRLDPDNKFSGSNNLGTYKQGNTTIQFGGRPGGSFNQQYNGNRMFDPGSRLDNER